MGESKVSSRMLAIGLLPAILVVSGLLYLGVQANNSARQSICSGNIETIASLLRNYKQKHGSYPPPTIYNENGTAVHSWRILLAQFAMPSEFAEYDMDAPWNSPKNSKFLSQMPAFFKCPNARYSSAEVHTTSYVAVVSGSGFFGLESELEDAVAEPKNPLLIVEVSQSSVPWTQPWDLNIEKMSFLINDSDNPAIGSHDPIGPVVLDVNLTRQRLVADQANTARFVESIVRGNLSSEDDTVTLMKEGIYHTDR